MADDPGFDEVFEGEHHAVFKAVYLILGEREAARDVTQDAFAQLYVHWPKVRRYDRPGAWVRRVAIRLALRQRTREARQHEPFQPADPTSTATATDVEDRLEILEALRRLTARQRAAVVLFYVHDLAVDEIAATLRCRPATVRVHLHDARAELARSLTEEGSDVAR